MIKHIFFDMVGVLAEERTESLTEEERIVFEAKDKYKFDEDFYEHLKYVFEDKSEEEINEIVLSETRKSLMPINLDIIAKIYEYDPKIKIHVITNHISVAKQWFHENFPYGISNVFTSGEIGVAKPSQYFFEYCLKKAGANKEESLYIDDYIKNTEVANVYKYEVLGMQQPLPGVPPADPEQKIWAENILRGTE